jgi:cytochrome c oxidase subunit IV
MEHPIVPRRTYILVYLALLVLFAATLGVAYVNISPIVDSILALLVATVKAALVVLFFMHVKYSDNLVKLFLGAGFVWLFILIGLTFTDYLTRTGLFFLNP